MFHGRLKFEVTQTNSENHLTDLDNCSGLEAAALMNKGVVF